MTKTTKKRIVGLIAVVLVAALTLFALVKIRDYKRVAERKEIRSQALAAYKEGDYPTAVPLFSKVVRREQQDYEATIAFAIARANVPAENASHILHAISLAKVAEEIDPGAMEPKELLLDLYAKVGFARELVSTALSILEIDAGHYDAMAKLPMAYLSLGDDEQAQEWVERFAIAHPEDLVAQRMHVAILLQQGASDDAVLEKLETIEQALGKTAQVSIVRASVMLKLGMPERAASHVRETLAKRPSDAGIVQQALSIAEAVVPVDPNLLGEAEAYLKELVGDGSLGNECVALVFEREWKSESMTYVIDMLKARSDEIEDLSDIALGYAVLVLIESDEDGLAGSIRERLAERDTQEASDWLAVADAYGMRSVESVSKVLQTDGANEVMSYIRGLFYRSIGENELAKSEWGAIAGRSGWRRARYSLSNLAIEQGRYREARGIMHADRRSLKTPREILLIADASLRIIEQGNSTVDDRFYAESLLEILRLSEAQGPVFDSIGGRLAIATGQDALAREYAQRLLSSDSQGDPQGTIIFANKLAEFDAALAREIYRKLDSSKANHVSVVLARAERKYDEDDPAGADRKSVV